ncbi:cyclic nucleotide-gated cation channel beta-3-like isoform X2 [Patiria miniata]|uniref:Cyclic nucleotide-binding domain-containing protein n=1 Tax=Patiria miniata TaxID=46514 RepID=A0A914B2E4_PATMI|nr:cyclic nucleotide-gated cation channel beta-3-like isoform X2 [Patiria miniata]
MSLPDQPVKHPPQKLEPIKTMASTQKLETMELHSLHLLGNTTRLPPVPKATTPTIRLSVPPLGHSQHHGVDIVTSDHDEIGGFSNAGYLSDGGAISPIQVEGASSGKQSSLSHLSSDHDGYHSALSTSPCPSNISVFSSTGDLSQAVRSPVQPILESLGLPHSQDVMHKRFSLPGSMDHLSPISAMGVKSSDPQGTSGSNGHSPALRTSSLQNSDLLLSSGSRSPSWGMSRWFQKRPSAVSSISSMSDMSCMSNSLDEDTVAANTRQKLQNLVKTVTQRAKKVGRNEVTPISTVSATLAPPAPTNVRKRLDSFAPSSATDVTTEIQVKKFWGCCRAVTLRNLMAKFKPPDCIDPTGGMWLAWLCLVAMVFIYNAVSIFLRASFPEKTIGKETSWLYFDYLGDLIYFLDIILHTRLLFFDNGQIQRDKVLMRKHYTKCLQFKFDVLCLLPLDFIYFAVGIKPILRLPRLLKVHSYNEFVEKFENKSKSANVFRVVKTIGYLLYMIHLNTCCYYVISTWEGIKTNDWVYDGLGNAYIRCLYRATKTLITIGNLPVPETTFEIFFMNIDFMVGVFVFATIIGQMRDIVGASGAAKGAFRRRMDNTMSLLKIWKIPESVQRRVRLWFMYSWDRRELLNEKEIMKNVPIKMQTDIAIHVHMDTLSKVSLFQDCDKMLLRDLVLKLRPVLFLPGDYICRKGEVGKEMYIIKNGVAQVLGGQNNRTVLATLHPGCYFGEISLLSVGCGNRRTADVYSPGYSNLFVLDKRTLQEVVTNYPNAQESLKRKAREILKKNQANDTKGKKRRGKSLIAESILINKDKDQEPSFFNAVLEVARANKIANTILRGSYRSGLDDIPDEVAHYSKSDISSDEIIFGSKGQRKKRKKLVKRAKKHQQDPNHSNDDSESQNEHSHPEASRGEGMAHTKRPLRRAASVTSPNLKDLHVMSVSSKQHGRGGGDGSDRRLPRESMGNMNLLWDKEAERELASRSSVTGSIPLEEDEDDIRSSKGKQMQKSSSKSSFSGIKERHLMARSISDVEREEKRTRQLEWQPTPPQTTETGVEQRPSTTPSKEDGKGPESSPQKAKNDGKEGPDSDRSEEDIDKGLSSDGSSGTMTGSDGRQSKASTLRGEGYDSSNEASTGSKN